MSDFMKRMKSLGESESHSLPDDDLGADRHPIVKVDHVVVDEPKAARRDGVADRLRLVRAVDAVHGLTEVHRARAHRIARAARHETRQVGLALDHFRRRTPVRPFLLARDLLQAGPLEALSTDTNAVADGPVVGLDEIEKALARIDDEGAGRFGRAKED